MLGEVAQITADAGLHKLTSSKAAERAAAISGLVPKRCGLCRHFNLEAGQRAMSENAHFVQAQEVLGPEHMGLKSTEEVPPRGSIAARALRPDLAEKFADYGLCLRWGQTILWGFEEDPPMPGPADAPCPSWE